MAVAENIAAGLDPAKNQTNTPTLINLYLVLPLDCPWIDAVKSSACPALSILECLARDGKTNCFIVAANCFVPIFRFILGL